MNRNLQKSVVALLAAAVSVVGLLVGVVEAGAPPVGVALKPPPPPPPPPMPAAPAAPTPTPTVAPAADAPPIPGRRAPDARARAEAPESYIWPDDVKITGRHLAAWTTPDGEEAMLFKGRFQLEIYKFKAESRDAVIWVRPVKAVKGVVYLVTVYLEGTVTVTNIEGTRTQSDRFLVSHASSGRVIRKSDTLSRTPAVEDGVYLRARLARQGSPPIRVPGAAAPAGEPAARPPADPAGAAARPLDPIPPEGVPFTAPKRRILFGRSDFELKSAGDQILVVLTGFRPTLADGSPGAIEPVRISYGDLELVADSMVLFTNRGLLESRGKGSDSGGRPDVAEGAYLEGDVQVNSRQYSLRASRLYYDFGTRAGRPERGPKGERAVVLDGVLRAYDETKGLPLYLRGSEIRLLARDDVVAENALLTSDDFNPPHFHIGAKRIHLWDIGVRVVEETRQKRLEGFFEAEDATFNVRSVPVLYSPFLAGNNDPRPEALRRLRFGQSRRLGFFGQSEWFLWKLLGVEPPIDGVNAYLTADVYARRGPNIGITADWDYERSFGVFRTNYLRDEGQDRINNVAGTTEPETVDRGRFLFRHKKYFDEAPEFGITRGWEVTFEISHISDRNYLLEFGRFEAIQDKEQESLIYLKKKGLLDQQNWAFHSTLQVRMLDFVSATERLPEFNVIGVAEPIGQLASVYTDNRIGLVQLRTPSFPLSIDPATGLEVEPLLKPLRSELTFRADTRNELTVPIDIGLGKVMPYVSGRATAYSDSPQEDGLGRVFGVAGIRALGHAHRTYNQVDSRFWDVNRLRHIITPEINAWVAGTNIQPDRLFIFDYDVEGPGAQSGLQLALRQTLQTKRGGPGRSSTVDWMFLDVEAGFFSNTQRGFDIAGINQFLQTDPVTNVQSVLPFVDFPPETNTAGIFRGSNAWSRPEDSLPRNHLSARYGWRVTEGLSLLADCHFDLDNRDPPLIPLTTVVDEDGGVNDSAVTTSTLVRPGKGISLDQYGLGINFDRSPRYSVGLGWRRLQQVDGSILTGNLSYAINEKYTIAVAGLYDLGTDQFVRSRIALSRRLPRFTLSLGADIDSTRQNTSFFFLLVPDGLNVNNGGIGF